MNHSKSIGFSSAMLVNKPVIIASFVLSLLAWWLRADAVAILLLTLCAIGLMSRLWGMFSLKDLDVSVITESTILSVGQSAAVTYKIENNKALPLVWLELCQDVPKNHCLEPELEDRGSDTVPGMTLREFSEEEAKITGKKNAYMRRFAHLAGHSDLIWSCSFVGKRRGVYRPSDLTVRSGDGFGLTQSVCEVPGLSDTVFVVWPKIVPVRTSFLLRNLWSGRTGRSGWTEDITVLRGEREYMPGDSWKRIDWRTAARTDELYTKQYELIRPQSVLFAVESYSFDDPEEALSITASLIFELSMQGIAAGIALPATKEKESVLIRPDDPAYERNACLFELADHDVCTASEAGFPIRTLAQSAQEIGQIWIVGKSTESIMAGRVGSALSFASPGYITEENAGISFSQIRA